MKTYRCNDCGTEYDTQMEADECCRIETDEKISKNYLNNLYKENENK